MKRKIFFVSISLWIYCFSLIKKIYLPLFLVFFLIYLLDNRYKLIVLFLIMFVNLSLSTEANFEVANKVINLQSYKYNSKFVYKSKKYFVYKKYKPGIYKVSFETKEFNNSNINYYKSEGFDKEVIIKKMELIRKSNSDFNSAFSKKVIERLKPYKNNKRIIYSLLFGSKDLIDKSKLKLLKSLGLIHLFVVSGFHMMIVKRSIEKFLKYIFVPRIIIDIVVLLFLFFLMYLTNFHISSVRTFIMILINISLNYLNIKIDKLETLGLSVILILLINPYNSLSYSFILGTLSNIAIYVKFRYLYFFIFPFLTYIGAGINIIFVFYSLIVSVILSFLLPMIFLSVFIDLFGYSLNIFLENLLLLSKFVFDNTDYAVSISYFNSSSLVIYYSSILLYFIALEKKKIYNCFKNNKLKLIIIFLLTIYINQFYYFNFYSKGVYFIDVNQGDSSLIITENNKKILIDTGNSKKLLTFLKSKNIKELDYLFISHFDLDHSKYIDDLKVKKIYVSNYKDKIKGFQIVKGNVLYIDNLTIRVLNPSKIKKSKNENSLCMIVETKDSKILYTGDISKKEFDFKLGEIDVLKFPHHGSKYSLNKKEILKLKPKITVLSYGRNRYNHPSKEVLDFYKKNNLKLWHTFISQTLFLKIK